MSDAPRALSVTEAMTLAKRTLEGVPLRVLGEVSEFTDRAGYKAIYFTLCDGSSVMPCLVWRDAYSASGLSLRTGMLVEVEGALTVYPPKGRMQFQVRSLSIAGEGALRLKVAELARRLEAEGLMRPERRRELPAFPERVALVTSPRGKAVHDVIRTLRRRYPAAELLIAGVAVEGADAATAIVSGLRAAGESGADVVILARGGGSYEDLMPFNDERVARAVVACPVPVVTGIGHEPDTSIADMVSDLRASTPTAAAEAVAPACDEVMGRLASLRRLLGRALLHAVRDAGRRVTILAHHPLFHDRRALTSIVAQRLDAAGAGLARAVPERLRREHDATEALRRRLVAVGGRTLERGEDRFARLAERLGDLSPLGILARGYAVCYGSDGRSIMRSAGALEAGMHVVVRLHDGSAGCLVESVRTEGTTDA